ncbi:MAG: alpha/beta hydrolase [Leptospiraceae bacterium]|nr:alpha/beta hydrolase [Leptospiraceae bacterium]MCK6381189.1 alpha/beta hydrolase [Leptospiraceae bacterium]NUM40455.1 alpha/beta hydrolase [Leptospiraceae bacterium]
MSETVNLHQRNGKFVEVDELNVFTIDQGEGEVIVLLHGLFGTSYIYRKLIPILSEKYRVVAPDLPGLGFSETPKEVYSHRYFARFIFRFLEKITDEKVHVVAHDYAGPISFLLLNDHPEKVKSLSVINTFLNLKKFRMYFPVSVLKIPFLGNMFSMFLNSFTLRLLFNLRFVSKQKPISRDTAKDYAFLLLNGVCRKNFVKICQSIDTTIHAQRDMESGIKKMIGGRQIIAGEKNPIIDLSEVEYIKQVMRLGFCNFIQGRHFLLEEYPIECAEKIEVLVKAFSKKGKI